MTETRGRPRRQVLKAEERRVQLETAALEIVGRGGYAAAKADAIVACAGVSKGLLWHYFTNLDELMASAARRALTLLEAEVAESIDLSAPLPELLREAIRRAALLPRTHNAELNALRQIVTNLRTPDGTPILGENEYARLYAGQAALLRRGQDEGHIRSDLDPYLLAVTYQGAVDTMLNLLNNHPELDAEAYAEHVADLLLHGMAS